MLPIVWCPLVAGLRRLSGWLEGEGGEPVPDEAVRGRVGVEPVGQRERDSVVLAVQETAVEIPQVAVVGGALLHDARELGADRAQRQSPGGGVGWVAGGHECCSPFREGGRV